MKIILIMFIVFVAAAVIYFVAKGKNLPKLSVAVPPPNDKIVDTSSIPAPRDPATVASDAIAAATAAALPQTAAGSSSTPTS